MIAINKAEKEAILQRFPNAFITRTMKHKSKRHRYYCEENYRIVRFLNEYRGLIVRDANNMNRGGDRHRSSKKRK